VRTREGILLGLACLLGVGAALAQSQNQRAAPAIVTASVTPVVANTPAPAADAIETAIGLKTVLAKLAALQRSGAGDSASALALRQTVLERVLLASFDVDSTLGRIQAEAAHASDSRYVLEAAKSRRNAELNIATFAVSGALGTTGAAMELTQGLNHAGNALSVASGATAVGLSVLQLKGSGHDRRVFRSPYNMLAEMLGATPNADSRYPAVVEAYLNSETADDGELPDGVSPKASLIATWRRLQRLQGPGAKGGASLASVTTDPAQGMKLTADELANREAMLRDMQGSISLLNVQLRGILLTSESGER
jgi:hypothetical protein